MLEHHVNLADPGQQCQTLPGIAWQEWSKSHNVSQPTLTLLIDQVHLVPLAGLGSSPFIVTFHPDGTKSDLAINHAVSTLEIPRGYRVDIGLSLHEEKTTRAFERLNLDKRGCVSLEDDIAEHASYKQSDCLHAESFHMSSGKCNCVPWWLITQDYLKLLEESVQLSNISQTCGYYGARCFRKQHLYVFLHINILLVILLKLHLSGNL